MRRRWNDDEEGGRVAGGGKDSVPGIEKKEGGSGAAGLWEAKSDVGGRRAEMGRRGDEWWRKGS